MSTEKSSSTGDVAKVVASLVENVPVYQDAIQPAAKELGKTLHLVLRAVNVMLSPLEAMVWKGEQLREFVQNRVAPKLADTPVERIQTPHPHIGVPVLEALRYTGSDPELSELYANLLATSMDSETAHRAHPAFVEMIKSMAPDEAKILRYLATSGSQAAVMNFRVLTGITFSQGAPQWTFQTPVKNFSLVPTKAGCQHTGLGDSYLENLARLGLVRINTTQRISAPGPYQEIEDVLRKLNLYKGMGWRTRRRLRFDRHLVELSPLGEQFVKSCIDDRTVRAQ